MKTFTLYTAKEFNDNAKTLTGLKNQRKEVVQTLAMHAVYMQAYNGKADFANNLASKVKNAFPRDYAHVTAFLLKFCGNLRATTKADGDQSKAFHVKKGVKPHDGIEAAEEAGNAAIAELPSWEAWAKEATVKAAAGDYDVIKAISSVVDNANKKTINPEQSAQFHALTSFMDYILAGKSLADLKAEFAVTLAGAKLETIAQVTQAEKRTGTHG